MGKDYHCLYKVRQKKPPVFRNSVSYGDGITVKWVSIDNGIPAIE